MKKGRIAVALLGTSVVLAGALLWYLQRFEQYTEYAGAELGFGPILVLPEDGSILNIVDIRGIKGNASPLKFRACFQAVRSDFQIIAASEAYDDPTPLIGPQWFDCFDAKALGRDLETGDAKAILLRQNIATDIDQVAAFYKDGRGFAWHQFNRKN